jgi:Delta3,5-Delta2,4-dienoyl-CoA isomerase
MKDRNTLDVRNEFGSIQVQPHPLLDEQYQYLRVLIVDPIDLAPHVTIVALNKPQQHNAICSPMWYEIGHVFQQLNRMQDTCRVIILTGIGATFCSGIDFTDPNFLPTSTSPSSSLSPPSSSGTKHGTAWKNSIDVARIGASFIPKLREMQSCFTALEECSIPIISAIHGPCIGAGIDLICCTDIRICCTTTAVFSIREVQLGLAPDIGTLQRLPKMIGHHSTMYELCYTGRNFSAQEAQDIGFISKQYCTNTRPELMRTAICDLGNRIAQYSPIAIQNIKASLLYARDHTVRDGLEQIAYTNAFALQGTDLRLAWRQQQKIRSTKKKASKLPRGDDDPNNNSNKSIFPNMLPHSKL